MYKIDVKATLPAVNVPLSVNNETPTADGVVMCRNMRPADGTLDRLVPVDDMAAVASGLKEGRVLGVLDHSAFGTAAVVADGQAVKVITGIGDPSAENKTFLLPLKSAPLCFLHDRDGSGIVMTESGPWRLEWQRDAFELHDLTETPPETSVAIGAEIPVTVGVPGATLKDDYTRSTSELSQTDSRALARALVKAYAVLVDKTSHAGYRVEPFLVRCRYQDAYGCDVYVSPAKLMLPPSGPALLDEQRCDVTEGRREAFSIAAQAFKTVVSTPDADEAWAQRVATLVVEATPCLPLVNVSALSVDNRLAIENGSLRFFMPGASADMAPDTVCVVRRLEMMLSRFETLATEVMRIDDPFGAGASQQKTLEVKTDSTEVHSRTVAVLKTLSKLEKQRSTKRQQRIDRLVARISLPHRFVASAGALNGSSALWTGITEIPSRGWSIDEWSLTTDNATAWQACVIVEMTDKSRRAVWSGQGAAGAPLTITPMLYYPSEEAVAFEIRVATAAGVAVWRSGLQALPGSGIAVARGFGLTPVALNYRPDEDFAVAPHTLLPVHHRAMAVSVGADDLLSAAGAVEVAWADIKAATAATATTSAWDYSRNRFYLFGSGGIAMAVVNDSSAIVSVQSLSAKGVADARHIATDASASGVTALAGGSLVRIKGSTVTDLGGWLPAEVSALAFDGSDLWITGENSEAYVRPGAAEGFHYLRDTPVLTDVYSAPGRPMLIVNSHGELLDGSRRYVADKDVEWSCRLSFPDVVRPHLRGSMGTFLRLTSIGLRLVCSALKARFVATTDSGSASLALVRVLLSVLLEGSLKSALRLPVRIGGRSHITLTLKGTVAPDARLHGVMLVAR